jgi:hypothetical protein
MVKNTYSSNNAVRNIRWLNANLNGKSLTDIAKEEGVSVPAVSKAIAKAKENMSPEDVALVRSMAGVMISHLLEIHFERAVAEELPPMFYQDKILKDDKGRIIRDARSSRDATDTVLKLLQRLAAMLGTDAATKADVNSTVKYTYEGVDPDVV